MALSDIRVTKKAPDERELPESDSRTGPKTAPPVNPRHPNRLYELRRRAKKSQNQVGKELGWKSAVVNRHERGNRSLDGFAIERYARYYGVSPYEIFVPVDYLVVYVGKYPVPEIPSAKEAAFEIIARDPSLINPTS